MIIKQVWVELKQWEDIKTINPGRNSQSMNFLLLVLVSNTETELLPPALALNAAAITWTPADNPGVCTRTRCNSQSETMSSHTCF